MHAWRMMVANRPKDAAPELAARSILDARGLRDRTNYRPESARRRIAVFIDGWFWRECPAHFVAPTSNVAYEAPKIERNRQRDHETNEVLRVAGWTVLRFWEHENPVNAADGISDAVASLIR